MEESAPEYPQPPEATAEEEVAAPEATKEEVAPPEAAKEEAPPETLTEEPQPKLRRRGKQQQQKPEPPYLEMPTVNNDFWTGLLATQRAMEKAARSERISRLAIA